jgi:hypothetical protein
MNPGIPSKSIRGPASLAVRRGFSLRFVIVTFAALWLAVSIPVASAKDKPEDFTRVYRHTYDDVFAATKDTIERMGMFVAEEDKDKGFISGRGDYQTSNAYGPVNKPMTFEIRIESVSPKPETRVSIINIHHKGWIASMGLHRYFAVNLLTELQKVLSTYK